MSDKNILITGGTGFIGSYVVMELKNAGYNISIFARNPDKVKDFKEDSEIKIIEGDLNDYDSIKSALKDQDILVHLALNWGNTPVQMLKNDTLSSVFLFEAAVEADLDTIIYTSSTAASGDSGSKVDETTRLNPVNKYGATKAATEKYLSAIVHSNDIRANVIRPGYTFGNPVVKSAPIQPDDRFDNIVQSALQEEDIELKQGDGTQFIWGGNISKIYLKLIENDNINNEIFYALSDEFYTWEKIAQKAIEITNSNSSINFTEDVQGEEPWYDVSKIEENFGFSFDPWNKIVEHLRFLVNKYKK